MIIKVLLTSIYACLFKCLHEYQWCLRRHYRYVVEHCIIDGNKAIIYKAGLQEDHPKIYLRLAQFAKRYGYLLKEDQRRTNIKVAYERRSATVSVLVLTFGLLAKNIAIADSQELFSMYENSVVYQEELSSNQEINQLMAWISQKIYPFNPDVTLEPPKLMNLPRKELYEMAYGKDLPLSVDKLSSKIYGLYDFQHETIYLLDSVDLNTNKGKSILLHELVHYFQYKNGYHNRVVCKNQLEYLAYYLEAMFMQEQGEPVGFTRDHLRRVVRCNH